MTRPQIIDESDGPCEICAAWLARRESGYTCDECGGPLEGTGIEGVAAHHYHLRLINGSVPGRVAVHQVLCPECNVKHRLIVYPPKRAEP